MSKQESSREVLTDTAGLHFCRKDLSLLACKLIVPFAYTGIMLPFLHFSARLLCVMTAFSARLFVSCYTFFKGLLSIARTKNEGLLHVLHTFSYEIYCKKMLKKLLIKNIRRVVIL